MDGAIGPLLAWQADLPVGRGHVDKACRKWYFIIWADPELEWERGVV